MVFWGWLVFGIELILSGGSRREGLKGGGVFISPGLTAGAYYQAGRIVGGSGFIKPRQAAQGQQAGAGSATGLLSAQGLKAGAYYQPGRIVGGSLLSALAGRPGPAEGAQDWQRVFISPGIKGRRDRGREESKAKAFNYQFININFIL